MIITWLKQLFQFHYFKINLITIKHNLYVMLLDKINFHSYEFFAKNNSILFLNDIFKKNIYLIYGSFILYRKTFFYKAINRSSISLIEFNNVRTCLSGMLKFSIFCANKVNTQSRPQQISNYFCPRHALDVKIMFCIPNEIEFLATESDGFVKAKQEIKLYKVNLYFSVINMKLFFLLQFFVIVYVKKFS